jgi:riboflavin synthase
MFTGIIETLGTVDRLEREGGNLHIEVRSGITGELKVDQSVAHNGVCLTVVSIDGDRYRVTAVDETLSRSNLGALKVGGHINLERAMVSGARLDGHMVQGHVDQTARCTAVEEVDGSWTFSFEFSGEPRFLLVEKGSVCVDGVSLTVAGLSEKGFTVAIIPYTFEHTIFHQYTPGSAVNIEFDVIGKYVHRYMEHLKPGM